MKFIKFGSKSVKVDSVEAVTTYMNEVTIHTIHNSYTVYYNNTEQAQHTYQRIVKELEGEENAKMP
jgi:hypothetical protein